MVELATRCMTGQRLHNMGFGTGLYKKSPYVAVKVPVFSFEKLLNVDTLLGPEMKSTGEVLGIATTREEALYKGLRAAGYKLHKSGGIFVTVRDRDKAEIIHVVKKFADLGFTVRITACLSSKAARLTMSYPRRRAAVSRRVIPLKYGVRPSSEASPA
jgi:carbamoyl-phosphate synthase large subunit